MKNREWKFAIREIQQSSLTCSPNTLSALAKSFCLMRIWSREKADRATIDISAAAKMRVTSAMNPTRKSP